MPVDFCEKKMKINLDTLHPDTTLFPFGTRMSMACPHMPGAKSIYRPIKREIKETMREGAGYRSTWFATRMRDILQWLLNQDEAILFGYHQHEVSSVFNCQE
jgi:hypothetical protein